MRYILVLGLSLIQIIVFSGISCAEKRTALVIGNGTYSSYKPLPNPVNDANDMADLLTDLGFDVIREINADRRTMVDAINRFGNKLFKSEVGIFYFAGHGMQIRKINYLIPVNTAMASEADAEYECVYVKRVLDKMKESGTRLNIIILDACRNNPLLKQLQSTAPSREIARKEMPPGLAQMSAPTGSIIAYATSEGKTASDGRGRNGVYTSALLKNLKNPSFTVQEVINQTGLDVMERTAGQQEPWTSSTPIPPFYLASGSTVVDESLVGTVLPETGCLRVNSQPSGAKILLNNSFKGHAPIDITGVAPGEYEVVGSLNGYISQEKKVRVNSGRRAMVTLYLDPVKTRARLFVTPNPTDARVRIMNIPDKYYNGIALDPGRYEVNVSSTGYITKTQWVDISASGVASGGIDLYVELEEDLNQGQEPGPGKGPDPGQVWKDPVTGMEFIWVPGGEFMMGSSEGSSDEKPVHKVHLDGFWMGKYEVTNGQYRQYKSSHDSKSYKGVSLNGDRQPAVYVSWDDTQGFIKWLNKKTGNTFALPTEAQWEYACRAGSTTQRFWGDSPDRACKYANVADQAAKQKYNPLTVHNCNDGFPFSAPVGSFQPNNFGLYDMLGNAWEWCEDIYAGDAYRKHGSNNPIYAQSGSYRVFRGGSWRGRPAHVRCASRLSYPPGYRYAAWAFVCSGPISL